MGWLVDHILQDGSTWVYSDESKDQLAMIVWGLSGSEVQTLEGPGGGVLFLEQEVEEWGDSVLWTASDASGEVVWSMEWTSGGTRILAWTGVRGVERREELSVAPNIVRVGCGKRPSLGTASSCRRSTTASTASGTGRSPASQTFRCRENSTGAYRYDPCKGC